MMLSNVFVVPTYTDGAQVDTGKSSWMKVRDAREFAKGFVTSPIAKQLVVMGPVDTHVWHKGEGWTSITTAEFRRRMSVVFSAK